ncbi:Uncharacterised protein [Klebsiella variicola]|nr:Uncharacterised protein [Klebsiella variicola]
MKLSFLAFELKQVCGNSPSDCQAFPIPEIEHRVTCIRVSVPRKIINSPFFKHRQHALADLPVRDNTDALMFCGFL